MESIGGFKMGVVNKIEDLIFRSKSLASIEIIKNKIVLIKMRCEIDHLSDKECHLIASKNIKYKILGENLQIKEYGDTYIKIEAKQIKSFSIQGGEASE